MIKRLLSLLAMSLIVAQAFSQVTLKGKVLSYETQKPLVGVNIRIDNSLLGGTTNAKGEFVIKNVPDGRHMLSFTYVGYSPAKYIVNGSNENINVLMYEALQNIGQVVVTGTGTHGRATNSPVPVTVITNKELRDVNASSLEDALTKLTPNISTYTNGMGTTMSMNGINESYLLILQNGKRLAGDDRYNRINISDVKRIEILNGAASALYGSDAIGGVINIITNDSKNAVNASSYSRVASEGRFTQTLSADVTAGKLSSYTSYQRNQAGSWTNNNIDENGKPTGRPTSVGFYSDTYSQEFDYNINDRLSVYLRGSYFDNKTRRPEDATYYKNKDAKKPMDAYKYNLLHETYTYGAGMKYLVNKKSYIDFDFFSDNFSSKWQYFKEIGGKNPIKPGDEVLRKRVRYFDTNLKGIFWIGSRNRVSVGTELINEYLKSESDNINNESMYTLAFYAQDEINIVENLKGVVGLRYLYNENFKSYATPNVALMYKLGPLNLRASYAAGYKNPTLSQLFARDDNRMGTRYTIGNEDLKPEKSNFYSLNAELNFYRIALSVTGFVNDIRDMINYKNLTKEAAKEMGVPEDIINSDKDIRMRDNVDKAKAKGISINANFNLGLGFVLGGGYTYMDTNAELVKFSKKKGYYKEDQPIDKSIAHMGNVRAQWEKSWGNYRLNINLNGHMQSSRFSQTYGWAPGYGIWDLNTKHTIYLNNFILEPGLGVENIFNKKDNRPWNNNFSLLSPGRSMYASLTIRFKK
ncbi:TonB-dependent receptor [Falsiporphyromonas endometrii]|uniref:TonB-dependent receptor domain-containing protein n=1 Tax=Falsiporphyromonas endometrii TaxID=1387297 RepID=A0ABV9K8V8_9PORP